MRYSNEFYYDLWDKANKELKDRFEDVSDQLCHSDQIIFDCFCSLKDNPIMEQPNASKVARAIGLPVLFVSRVLRKIKRQFPQLRL